MKTTKIGVLFLALMVGMAGIVTPTMAATEDEIQNSIDKGVVWLLGQQNVDGSWGSSDQVARTGFALVKLEDRSREKGFEPLDPTGPYYDAISTGLDYLMTQKNNEDITGDPSDKNSNGNAISFNSGGWHQTYHTGIALMAIANSGDYATDVQDMVDWFIKYQNPDGGWRYTGDNQNPSDNSNVGYAALGLGYAEQYGADIGDIKTGLSSYVDYIQNDVDGDLDDGGSGYTGPNDGWVNILKTGNLIFEAGLVGDTAESQRVKDAADYIVRHWNDNNADPGWRPHHYQAMYAAMKGLESLQIEKIGSAPEIDWYAEFSTVIVATQNVDGSWPNDYWGDSMLSTVWALLTLEKVTIVQSAPGFMTGGGSVFTKDGVRVTHGFELNCDRTQTPNNLEINWGKGNKFHLDTLVSATCIDDLAIEPNPPKAGFDTYRGTGTGEYNGVAGATAKWIFTDAGEPGKDDTASIEISDANGVILTVSGKLDRGNQQAHKSKEK